MLQQVTDRRLAEADHRVLDGVYHWTRLAIYGRGAGVTGVYSFMGHCGNFESNTIVNRQPVLKYRIQIRTGSMVQLPATTRARVF